jgi:uncharacterized membrane protein
MFWDRLQRLRNYVNSSLWVIPFLAIPAELVTIRAVEYLGAWLGWNLLRFSPAGAEAILQSIVTATLSFLVFTFGSILVAIQVASGQMTPRIIATTLLRNNVVKYTVGLFIFTLLFSSSVQNRMDSDARQLLVFVAAALGLSCFAAFLYLIDYASRLLRPISILTLVGNDGLEVIETVYPELTCGPDSALDVPRRKLGSPGRVIQYAGTSGIVLSVDLRRLTGIVAGADGVVEVVPQVGDFVSVDEPLFNLYGGAIALTDANLRSTVVFGSERTMEQDPTFSFRIVIDIALKALSPAINDPTTAVLAIDQLHRLLRKVGTRHLRTDEIPDNAGRLRIILRTPNWEDFVHLAFNEIRACGSNSMQVVRRLRAMVENLMQTLPVHRHPALQQELSLLDRDIERQFSYPEDRALARIADTQGLGGHSSAQTGLEPPTPGPAERAA